MIFPFNLAVIATVTERLAKLVIIRGTIPLTFIGLLDLIYLWWIVALANPELIPTPLKVLVANLGNVLHPLSQHTLGNLGLGCLLLVSLRRILIGFGIAALVAIPITFLIGVSKNSGSRAPVMPN